MAFGVTVGASNAGDGWSYRDSWDDDRQGVEIASNVLAATTERATVVDAVSPVVSNVYYRSQYENLVAQKAKTAELLPYFADTSKAEVTEGTWNFNNYFESTVETTNHSDLAFTTNRIVVNAFSIPMLSLTNACIAAWAPSNYFSHTPYRCLNGSGAYTSDGTVGHPHGVTNEFTINGGTNFPGSRTNWYDTDYGWDHLQDIINLMVWTQHSEQALELWYKYPNGWVEKWGGLPGVEQKELAWIYQTALWEATFAIDPRSLPEFASHGQYSVRAYYKKQKWTNGWFCAGGRVSAVPVVSNIAGTATYTYDAQVYRSFGGRIGEDTWYQFDSFVPAFADINKFVMASNWTDQTTNILFAVDPYLATMTTNPVLQIWPVSNNIPAGLDDVEVGCLGESIVGTITPASPPCYTASPTDYDHDALWLYKWDQSTNGFQYVREP